MNDFSINQEQDHSLKHLFTQITPASPFILYAFGNLIFLTIAFFYKRFCKEDKGQVEVEDLVVIESLKPFFATLKNKDREFWFTEEKVGRERIRLKRISDKNYLNLIFAQPNKT